ncbi:MAG: type IV pilus biogenesis protein PilM [Pirellulaceae bacterium]
MIKRSFRKPVLAVQWDRTTVDYVLAERKGSQITVTAVGSLARGSDDVDAEELASPGELLRDELQRRGVRHPELLVALGRGSVDVIPLQLPPAGDDELPTLVANQVLRDAGDIVESGIIDYVPLDTPEGQPRQVFAFVVDGSTIQQIHSEASKAGLKLCALVYRPLSSVTLLQRLVPQSRRTMLLVTLHDREADLSIVRNGHLLYTRTARLVESNNLGDIAAQLAVEVRRSLAAASLTADPEEQHLYVFGSFDESEQLVQDLAEELSLPASLLDPLIRENVEGIPPASVGRIPPLIGMIHEHFDATHPLDFLHPKRPPAPPNYYRQGVVYAAAVLALVGAGAYYLWDANQQAASEIADLRKTLDNTIAKLEKVKQKQAVVDAVWRWETDNVNWLDELYDLTRRFPNGRDAIIRRLTISPGRGEELVVDLYVQVRDPAVITQLGDQLRDAFHDVRSKGVSEQSSSTDYPWQFETRITLRKRDVDDYRKSMPDVPRDGNIAATPFVTREQP